MGERQLVRIDVSTVVEELEPRIAEILGYSFQTSHHCMECGERIGQQQLVNHARFHAGLPPKPRRRGHVEQGSDT